MLPSYLPLPKSSKKKGNYLQLQNAINTFISFYLASGQLLILFACPSLKLPSMLATLPTGPLPASPGSFPLPAFK
jgi:hypothetical protein